MDQSPTRIPGLFITGTDTGVGKTYVAGLIARALAAGGRRVGVYKPAASGCTRQRGTLVSDDAVALWNAAGRPGELERVCPQRFAAPLAPHLAARAEGKQLDAAVLRQGLEYWRERSEIVLVEGAGGLMSPLGERKGDSPHLPERPDQPAVGARCFTQMGTVPFSPLDSYVADLAEEFAFPLVVVARNVLGTINQTLQTLIAAAAWGSGAGLPVAGVVLNHPAPPPSDDASPATNRAELAARCVPPILAEVFWNAEGFDAPVDWFALAR